MLTGEHIRYLTGAFAKVRADYGAALAECNGEAIPSLKAGTCAA